MPDYLTAIRPRDDEEELLEECECGECGFDEYDACLCKRNRLENIMFSVRSDTGAAVPTSIASILKSTR